MRRTVRWMSILVCTLLVTGSTAGEDAISMATVRQLEIGYRLGEAGNLKMRVTVGSGEVFEYSSANADETTTLLRLAELFNTGRVDLSASVDNHKVRSLQCTIRRF